MAVILSGDGGWAAGVEPWPPLADSGISVVGLDVRPISEGHAPDGASADLKVSSSTIWAGWRAERVISWVLARRGPGAFMVSRLPRELGAGSRCSRCWDSNTARASVPSGQIIAAHSTKTLLPVLPSRKAARAAMLCVQGSDEGNSMLVAAAGAGRVETRLGGHRSRKPRTRAR